MNPFDDRITNPIETFVRRQVILRDVPTYKLRDNAEWQCSVFADREGYIYEPTSVTIQQRHPLLWAEVPDWVLSQHYGHYDRHRIPLEGLSDYDGIVATCRMVKIPTEVSDIVGPGTVSSVQNLMRTRTHITFAVPPDLSWRV